MILKKTKLITHKGDIFVDLRSDEIERLRATKKTARIIVGDEFMDLPAGKLRFGKQITNEIFPMRFYPYGNYTLISFKWKPIGKLTELQISLLKI